jgi:hypothetical protein
VSNSEVRTCVAFDSSVSFEVGLHKRNDFQDTGVSVIQTHIGEDTFITPGVLSNISGELVRQKEQIKLSLESRVENPESTINSF